MWGIYILNMFDKKGTGTPHPEFYSPPRPFSSPNVAPLSILIPALSIIFEFEMAL